MSQRDWQYKLFIGSIALFIAGTFFTGSVRGDEGVTLVTPLVTVSSYEQPKEGEPDPTGLNSLSTEPSDDGDENTLDNHIPVPFPEDEIFFEKSCEPTDVSVGEEIACTVTITNNGEEDFSYKLVDFVSKRLSILEDTVEGGNLIGRHIVTQRGVLAGGTLPSLSIEKMDTSLAYNSLGELGIPPLTDVQDEAMINVATLEPYVYGGEEYTTIGIASNGYLIPGLGSDEDITYIPQIFPDPTIPNNVIALFWTDLNPEVDGNIYAALLTRDGISWVVIEWENVPAYDSERPLPNCDENCGGLYTFQAWIKTNTTEQDVTFIYERVDGGGSVSGLNIGVEDKEGLQGANYDALPTVQDELAIVMTPGTEGESHVISYSAEAQRRGHWYGCALTKVYRVYGVAFDCTYGSITE